MLTSNYKISIRQMQILFILDIFGTGVIVLPRICTSFAGNDGWIPVIGGSVLALFYGFLLNSLACKFPRQSFVEFSQRIMGAPLGALLSALLMFRFVTMAGMELRLFGEVIRQTMLYQTPIEITCGAMLLLASYLVFKGYETRARVGEILIFIILVPLLITFFVAALGTDFTNILPMLKTPTENLVAGSFYVSLLFRGLELSLLIYPFVKQPRRIIWGQSVAIIVVGVIMLFLTVITIARFGAKDTNVQLWPIIQMMDTIDYPGRFFERQDAIVLSFWIISIYIAISAGVFFSSLIAGKLFKSDSQNKFILPCALIIFIISMMPENIVETYKIQGALDMTLGIFIMVAMPMLMIFVAKIRKIGDF